MRVDVTKLDDATLEKCREAAKDIVRKLGGLKEPDVTQEPRT